MTVRVTIGGLQVAKPLYDLFANEVVAERVTADSRTVHFQYRRAPATPEAPPHLRRRKLLPIDFVKTQVPGKPS